MKTYHHLTVFIFLFFLVFGFSQKNSVLIGESSKIPGTKFYCEPNCNSSDPAGKFGNAPLANGNGSIATSYTYSACGLDFTYHSAALHKRNFSFGVSPNNQLLISAEYHLVRLLKKRLFMQILNVPDLSPR